MHIAFECFAVEVELAVVGLICAFTHCIDIAVGINMAHQCFPSLANYGDKSFLV